MSPVMTSTRFLIFPIKVLKFFEISPISSFETTGNFTLRFPFPRLSLLTTLRSFLIGGVERFRVQKDEERNYRKASYHEPKLHHFHQRNFFFAVILEHNNGRIHFRKQFFVVVNDVLQSIFVLSIALNDVGNCLFKGSEKRLNYLQLFFYTFGRSCGNGLSLCHSKIECGFSSIF